jgi:glucose-6-phosphate-specific signal transduction histidine kinase
VYWLLQFGPLGSPPALLVALVVLAAIILVGRFVLAVAWRLVLLAVAVALALWVLAGLGFETGVF